MIVFVPILGMSKSENLEPKETVRDRYGIDTGMTKDEFEKFKEEYNNYQKNNKISVFSRNFYTKINILAIDKLKKYDIGLNKSLIDCNINDFIIRSELIIIGTLDSIDVSTNMNLRYPITIKVEVNEVIANSTEYKEIPEYITLKNSYLSKGDLGKKFLMLLTRDDFHYFRESHEQNKSKEIVTDDCFYPYTFTPLAFSLQEVKDIGFLFIPYEHPYYPGNRRMELDELKRNVEAIIKINDAKNFYKRSYR